MIAALPMYDRPETAAALDGLWAGIRDRLRAAGHGAPEALSRQTDPCTVWRAPDLVLAQTCGMPYRTVLHPHVALVGTLDHGVPECQAGFYRSVLVAHRDDPRRGFADFDGAALAYNEAVSQSGWAAARTHADKAGIRLRAGPRTGAHRASARLVATGRAELASIDAVSWALMCRHDDFTRHLRVVERTEPTPGLPLITAAGGPVQALRDAVAGAVARLAPADRDALFLRGVVRIPARAYLAVPVPPGP